MSTWEGSDTGLGRLHGWTGKLPISSHEGSNAGLGGFRCRSTKAPMLGPEASDAGIEASEGASRIWTYGRATTRRNPASYS